MALCKEYENIVGVKEASGNFSAIAQIASLSGGTVDIYSGNDDQTVPMMALGAKGVISVLSNVAPRQVHDMCAAFKAGDVAKARQMQIDAIPLIEALFCEVNPIPVKEAMNMMGEEVGPFRKPLVDMEPANRDRLRRELVNYGISLKERKDRYCTRVGTFGTESAVRKRGGSRNLPYLNAKPRQIPLLDTYACTVTIFLSTPHFCPCLQAITPNISSGLFSDFV